MLEAPERIEVLDSETGTAKVKSSDGNTFYAVVVANRTCTCPDKMGSLCKHIRAVGR